MFTLGCGTRSREENGAWCPVMGVSRAIRRVVVFTDADFYCIYGLYRYYEWITKGKDKLPHFIRRHESKRPLWLGGLWDCVTLEGLSSRGTEAASYCGEHEQGRRSLCIPSPL